MSQEVKFDVNNGVSLEYSCDVKEEFQDVPEYISESAITDSINISNSEMNEYIRKDKIGKCEMPFVELVKTDLPLLEVNDTVSNNVKRENGICAADIETVFCNELLSCNHCHEVYQDYCTKCRVLVHILNENPSHNTYDRAKELPKYMLETRESIGHLGIFSLKVIPEDVIFGPFTGLNSTGLPLRIKGGRFVVSDDKLQHLNWMQFISPARNIYEQNLLPFQCEDKLYYCSTRRIQGGEELLLYFGKEYDDNLLKNVEMDFVPITKAVGHVFACIFCCLGFRSKEYLAEHKAVHHSETKEMFSVEELAQCLFCKIYMEAKEYFEHHMDYCSETNDRNWVPRSPEVHELGVERCSSEKRKTRKWKCEIFKCSQCQFRTIYGADFRQHTNEHYKVKIYKCGICHKQYKAKESLKVHVEKCHGNNERGGIQKYTTFDYIKANIRNIKESTHSHDGKCKFQIKMKHQNRGKYKCTICGFKTYYRSYLERHMKIKHLMGTNYKCSECEFETNYKRSLVSHKNAKHLKARNYKCTQCEFKTYYKSNLATHIEAKHLKQKYYKCAECEYVAYRKSTLQVHIQAKHLKLRNYKCTECEYMAYRKSTLRTHIQIKHLKKKDYKCTECEYRTNCKSHLEIHIKTKHLNQNDYKCVECEFMTNYKSNFEKHIKAKHLKQKDYKCTECEHISSRKSSLQVHIEAKHLKHKDYKCTECEFKTNYKSILETHIKAKHLKQKDYKCTECEHMSSYKSNLQVHIEAKHLKQKDYKCTECEFKTNYKSNLETHKKAKHLKQKDYKCTECEYMSSRKSYLQLHMEAKHLK